MENNSQDEDNEQYPCNNWDLLELAGYRLQNNVGKNTVNDTFGDAVRKRHHNDC